MRTLFFMGRNDKNISGVSWKIWRVEQKGRRVRVWWGPATLFGRRAVLVGVVGRRSWTFGSEKAAREDARRRVAEKLAKGYEVEPR